MAWFALRPRSLTNKLTMLAACSGGIALALSCAAFVFNDIAMSHTRQAEELRETTEVLATASAESLQQANPRALRNILMAHHHRQQIHSVHVFDARGDLFGRFEREQGAGSNAIRPSFIGHRFTSDGFLEVCLPIRTVSEEVGSIHIRAMVRNMTSQITRYVSIAAGVAPATFLLTIVICRHLHRPVTAPIQGLTQSIKRVTDEMDFSIRLKRQSNDEIGDLFDEVNAVIRLLDRSDTLLRAQKGTQQESRVRPDVNELSDVKRRTIPGRIGSLKFIDREGRTEPVEQQT